MSDVNALPELEFDLDTLEVETVESDAVVVVIELACVDVVGEAIVDVVVNVVTGVFGAERVVIALLSGDVCVLPVILTKELY